MNSEQGTPPNADDDLPEVADGSVRDPLEVALTEFTDEKRRGKAPSIDDFVQRYPDLADQIRELFPLVDNLERWKDEKEVECLRRNVPKEFSFDKLGEYQLVRELGRGGMGVVFHAVHETSHRPVAIKLLPWRFAADMTVWKDRLRREAMTIAALKHPNIVQIYSFSQDQGYYYYVMQFIDGVGLDKIIQQLKQQRGLRRSSRKFFPTEASRELGLTYDAWRGFAKLGEQIALALDCAHKHDVLHNDIKPSNLLVRSNGQVIVTDFGIGGPRESELADADDHSVGTLMYLAPERWNGNGSPKSDIYSLGATLYELATQSPIFDCRKRSQLIDAILNREPTGPRRLVAEIPVPLERIILKAMAKDPQERYASAHAMAQDLRRFVNRQPIEATEQKIWQRAAGWLQGWFRSGPKKSR